MAIPVRSLRLQKRSAQSLNTLSGSEGEIFYDNDANTLRIYTNNAGQNISIADRAWVTTNTFSGSYTNLTDKPVIPADITDLTDTSNALFSGNYNDLTNLPDIASEVDITTIDNIGDVDTTTTPPTSGQLLQWDGANWVNTTVSGFADTNTTYSLTATEPSDPANDADLVLTDSNAVTTIVPIQSSGSVSVSIGGGDEIVISGTAPASINDLTDVNISNQQTNDVLAWDGGQWIASSSAGGGGIDLTSLSVGADAAASENGSITYDDTTGVFTYAPPDLTSFAALDGFSVTTDVAQSGGVLTYDNSSGEFTFRPANLSGYTELTDFSIITDGNPSGGGSLSYNSSNGEFTFVPAQAGGDLVADTSPQLGASLDLNSYNITGTGDINITGTITGTSFSSGAVGAPVVTSASTITLTAPDGLIVTGGATGGPFRLPSFTTTERNAITAVNGDMIYNSSTNKAQVRENGAWVDLV